MLNKFFKNKFAKETFWSFLSKFVTFGLFYALNIYLARVLGVEVFGQWSFFYSILSMILLVSYFGINASSKTYIAKHSGSGELKAVLKAAFQARFIFSFCVAAILAIFSKELANLLSRPELTKLFLLSSPLVFFSGGVEFLKDAFVGLHLNKYNFIINSIEFGLKFFLVLFFFQFSIQLSAIIDSYVISLFLAALVGGLIVYFNFYRGESKSQNRYLKQIIHYSFPLFFVSIGFWIATEIDTVMIGYLKTSYDVGIYAAAKQIIVKLPHLAIAISMGTMPIFAKLDDQNREKLRKIFAKLIKANTAIFFSIAVIIITLANWFMPKIYGSNYVASAMPLILLLPYLIMFSYSVFFSTLLDFRGLAKKRAINISFTIVANILLNYLLIPKYGVNGASIATSISYLPYFVLNYLEVKKELS